MKKKIIPAILFFIILLSFIYFTGGCDDSGVEEKGDHVTGYVTFTDTNLTQGGYYAVSMFENKSNPFNFNPLRSDALTMTKNGNQYICYFKFSGVASGSYYFAVTFNKTPPDTTRVPPVLGTRGCDTNHNCTAHKLIAFPNYSYEDCNILSWTDTTKKLN